MSAPNVRLGAPSTVWLGERSVVEQSTDIGEQRVVVDRFEIIETNPMDTYYRAVYGPDGSPLAVPNRLYGATINHEGEAV